MKWLTLLALLALPSLVNAQPLHPITGGIPPTLSVTLSGAGPLSGAYTVVFVPSSDPGVNPAKHASGGYLWSAPISISPAVILQVRYSGNGFPGTMLVSASTGPGPVLEYFGDAPDAASSWNVTLPGVVAGTANVRP